MKLTMLMNRVQQNCKATGSSLPKESIVATPCTALNLRQLRVGGKMKQNFCKAVLCVALVGSSMQVFAQARPDARKMTCAAIQNLIKKEGSVVFTTGQYTWDTYVADGRYCSRRQRIAPAKIPSADKKKCVVYYQCRQSLNTDD